MVIILSRMENRYIFGITFNS